MELVFFPILNGNISIGHKPGGKISYSALKHAGITTILTLLNENEGALSIKKGTEEEKLHWIWFPFSASNPPQGDDVANVKDLYSQLRIELELAKNIYIHCSAGIHRTGMVTYGLLRFLVLTSKYHNKYYLNYVQLHQNKLVKTD